jgi:hypothetical protein
MKREDKKRIAELITELVSIDGTIAPFKGIERSRITKAYNAVLLELLRFIEKQENEDEE